MSYTHIVTVIVELIILWWVIYQLKPVPKELNRIIGGMRKDLKQKIIFRLRVRARKIKRAERAA